MDIGVDVARKYKGERDGNSCDSGAPRRCGGPHRDRLAWFRPPTQSPLHGPAHAVKILKITSSALKSSRRLLPLFEGVDRCFAIQAGREIRIMVKPDVITDDKMILLAKDICKRLRTTSNIPARSRSTLFVRAVQSSTQNNNFTAQNRHRMCRFFFRLQCADIAGPYCQAGPKSYNE